VRAVIELVCTPETVFARLTADTGGDRAGRTDDDLDLVRRKLDTYARRTAELVEHYRRRGAAGISLTVGPNTSARQMWQDIEQQVKP